MKIKVFNELSIQKFKTDEEHIVISIQDPSFDLVSLPKQTSRKASIGFKFHDLDQDIPGADVILFNVKEAKAILNFVEAWKDKVDLICINCVAGVSRSMGVAGALGKILNGDDTYFFKHGVPNMRIYRMILENYYGKDFNDFNKINISENKDIIF